MNYHHFTIEERCSLREYYVKGKSYREIAKLLGRNVSSISRELRRNCTFYRDIPRHYPYTAQKKSKLRNSYRHRGMFWKQEVLEYIDEKLSQTWSPEQIANTPCGMKMPPFSLMAPKSSILWLRRLISLSMNIILFSSVIARFFNAVNTYMLSWLLWCI